MIEVWINTNEQVNDDPSEQFYDVEVSVAPCKTILFEFGTGIVAKQAAEQLKQAISNAETVHFN